MRSLLFSFLLLFLLAAHASAFWPFNYGEMEDPWPVLSVEVNGTTVSLDNLNDDILHIICDLVRGVKEKVPDDPGAPDGPEIPGQFPPDMREQSISALRSLSMTNKRFRDFATPWLFQSIKIGASFSKASKALRVLEHCPAALAQARTFKFDIFEENGQKSPPRDLPSRFLSVLQRMDKLSTIHLSIPEYQTDKFANVFAAGNLSLPDIRTLVLASFNDFLIKYCPGVETVSTDGWQFLYSKRGHYDEKGEWRMLGEHARRMIESAAKAENLSYFEMNQFWSERELEEVWLHMPKIKRLGMPGGKYRWGLKDLLPILARFTEIDELILADASNLDVGFHPPGCGNAYMGPDGDEIWKQVEAEGRTAAESVAKSVAKSVFQTCAPLKKLWVGDRSRAEVLRDEESNVLDIKWYYEMRQAPSGWVV